MHECFTVQDWIRSWTEVETGDQGLSACRPYAESGMGVLDVGVSPCGDQAIQGTGDPTPGVPDEVIECPRCMAACDELDALLERLEHFDPAVAAESFECEETFRSLASLPPAERLARVASDPRLHRWSLCQRFLSEAQRLWLHEPDLSLAHAETGVAIAEALDEETYHPRWVADLRAKARAYLGNALRVLARFADAEREFEAAERHLHRGVESGQREARILSFKASLRIDQGLHRQAEEILNRIERYYENTDQRTELSRTQLKRALVLAGRGEFHAAAEECARAYGNLDVRREPRLALIACQNAVLYLLDAGETMRARSLFSSLAPTDERMLQIRRRWLEASLLRAEGRPDLAMEAYDDARGGYVAEGIPYSAAIISLDKALLAFEMGDHEQMQDLTVEAERLLRAAGARREATAVLHVLTAAIEQGRVTRSVLGMIRKKIADAQPSC